MLATFPLNLTLIVYLYERVCGRIKSFLSPHKAFHNAGIALDNADDFRRDVFGCIIRYRRAEVAVLLHPDSKIDRLQKLFGMDSGQDETSLVQCFRSLCGCTNTHCRERLADRKIKTCLFRQCAALSNDAKGIHLEAIVIMKAQRLMGNHTFVQDKAALFQPVSATWMTGIQYRHIIFFCHCIDCLEERIEVFRCVDIFLPVSGKQNVAAIF